MLLNKTWNIEGCCPQCIHPHVQIHNQISKLFQLDVIKKAPGATQQNSLISISIFPWRNIYYEVGTLF